MSNDSFIEIIEVDPASLAMVVEPASGPLTSVMGADTLPDMTTVFRLRPDARSVVKKVKLPVRCWELLYRIDGTRTIAQLAEVMDESPLRVSSDCQRLLCQGLLVEVGAVSYEEFRGRRSRRPQTGTEAVSAASMIEEPTLAARSPADMLEVVATHPKLLPNLMRIVREARGGGRRGDLAVYLMFTRVPSELFREAGLRSFLYIDESTELNSRPLCLRLVKEAELIVGHALGDKLYASLDGPVSRPN